MQICDVIVAVGVAWKQPIANYAGELLKIRIDTPLILCLSFLHVDSTEAESTPYRCSATSANTKRKRRKRTIFTSEQLNRLESEFDEQQYMVGTERQQLAQALNLSETQVSFVFFPRRPRATSRYGTKQSRVKLGPAQVIYPVPTDCP